MFGFSFPKKEAKSQVTVGAAHTSPGEGSRFTRNMITFKPNINPITLHGRFSHLCTNGMCFEIANFLSTLVIDSASLIAFSFHLTV